MKIAVVGAGLAGALLAWRLGLHDAGRARRGGASTGAVTLFGVPCDDATGASGGLVRAFEPDPASCVLAGESLAELFASPTLRIWSDYRPTHSVYVCRDRSTATGNAATVDALLGAGSVELLAAADLDRGYGFAGSPPETVAVVERRAGYLSPGGLRAAVLAELPRLGVSWLADQVQAVRPEPDGSVSCVAAGEACRFDRVVLATGRWTGRLLTASGLPADGFATKHIQYTVHRCTGTAPSFVDEVTGLYGRPCGPGEVLLGMPSDNWWADPDHPADDEQLAERVLATARVRLPELRPEPRHLLVSSADCYPPTGGLALRPLAGLPEVYTFTGGSGGAVKTSLAASRVAAAELRDQRPNTAHHRPIPLLATPD